MDKYYNGNRLLTTLDINKKKPEIYICCNNRSAGKTTYFTRYLVNNFIKKHQKFALLYRYKNELEGVAQKFFSGVQRIWYQDLSITDKPMAGGHVHQLYLGDTPCGYAIAINSAAKIKVLSHMLSDTEILFFDEFQLFSGYVPKEVEKLINIHTSIARGNGEQSRYLPLIMCGNPIDILNPYYTKLNIISRLQNGAKIIRGDGWVLDQAVQVSAVEAQKSSTFLRAFGGLSAEATQEIYGLYISDTTIHPPPDGGYQYVCNITTNGLDCVGIKVYNDGIAYADTRIDPSITTYTQQYSLIDARRMLLPDYYRVWFTQLFRNGLFRFRSKFAKNAIFTLLSV